MMADVIDDAQKLNDVYLKSALSNMKPEGPKANGSCHNCAEPLHNGTRFCDMWCRDDWQVREDKKSKRGKQCENKIAARTISG